MCENNTEGDITKSEKELYSVVLSIIQEGWEKAEEIDSRAEEELNILKRNVIDTEIENIEQQYHKKEAQCVMTAQIKHGKLIHDVHMEMVNYKMKILEEIKKGVRVKLVRDMDDNKRKQRVLKNFILECLYKILENEVMIHCRQKDETMIRNILPEIEKRYEIETKTKITIYVNNENYLPKKSLPGVRIRTLDGKISIFNSLEERLEQIMKSSLPVLGQILFGSSKMRK